MIRMLRTPVEVLHLDREMKQITKIEDAITTIDDPYDLMAIALTRSRQQRHELVDLVLPIDQREQAAAPYRHQTFGNHLVDNDAVVEHKRVPVGHREKMHGIGKPRLRAAHTGPHQPGDVVRMPVGDCHVCDSFGSQPEHRERVVDRSPGDHVKRLTQLVARPRAGIDDDDGIGRPYNHAKHVHDRPTAVICRTSGVSHSWLGGNTGIQCSTADRMTATSMRPHRRHATKPPFTAPSKSCSHYPCVRIREPANSVSVDRRRQIVGGNASATSPSG